MGKWLYRLKRAHIECGSSLCHPRGGMWGKKVSIDAFVDGEEREGWDVCSSSFFRLKESLSRHANHYRHSR